MLSDRATQRLSRDEHGVTLVETLVALVTGVVVLGALFTLFEISLHQSTRLADAAQATQAGRTTMTRIVDALHSSCLAKGFTPIQEGSSAKELIVISGYSEKATIEPSNVRKDRFVWSEGAETLTDTRYQSNGGEWPKFTFPPLAQPTSVTRIGERITQTENEKKEKLPVFRYYAYASKASSSTGAPSSTLNEGEPLMGEAEKGLTSKEAQSAASVLVSFRTGPSSGNKEARRSIDLSNQVTFAFSAPNIEAPLHGAPCE